MVLSIALYGAPSMFTSIDAKEAKAIVGRTTVEQQVVILKISKLKKTRCFQT